MRIVVDRIEGPLAIVEIAGALVPVPRALLPSEAHEGSVLTFVIAEAPSEAKILEEGHARLRRLALRGPPGDDIDL